MFLIIKNYIHVQLTISSNGSKIVMFVLFMFDVVVQDQLASFFLTVYLHK